MKAKVQKLEKQATSVDIQSSIFKGISVFVNGYTGMHQVFHMIEWLQNFYLQYMVWDGYIFCGFLSFCLSDYRFFASGGTDWSEILHGGQ